MKLKATTITTLTLALAFVLTRANADVMALPTSPPASETKDATPNMYPAKVLKVTGRVLARMPFDSNWRTVWAGQKLYEGTLVQVPEGSSLTFEYFFEQEFAGMKAKDWRVEISTPTVLRLNHQALRAIKLSPLFMDGSLLSSQNIKSKEPNTFESLGRDFKSAWNAISPVIKNPSGAGAAMQSLQNVFSKKSGIQISGKAKPLKVLSPRDQTLVTSAGIPASVKIIWEKAPIADAAYNITMFKGEGSIGKTIAMTKDNEYQLSILEDGVYYLQVETQDGQWQSRPVQLTVDRSEKAQAKALMADVNNPQAPVKMDELIKVSFPPKLADFFTPDETSAIKFQIAPETLELAAASATETKPTLLITPLGTKEDRAEVNPQDVLMRPATMRLSVQHGAVTAILPVGTYLWQITGLSGEGGAKPMKSDIGYLRVTKRNKVAMKDSKKDSKKDPMSAEALIVHTLEQGKAGRNNVLFLEDGL